ncbi:hypothetical protein CWN88_13300 [Vibrio splendidus]|nr:hypothetical protein CWN82_06850 [Vibrio splendidus]PTP01225.1 hypothetical protein CWN88_13300 [Vibrio splendidus]
MGLYSPLKSLRKTTVGNNANLTPKIFSIYKMTRINLFIACNESTLILHQQLILIYFGKLKNNVSKIRNVTQRWERIRIKTNQKVEIYSRFGFLFGIRPPFDNKCVSICGFFDEPHTSMQVWEKYIGLKEPNIAKK